MRFVCTCCGFSRPQRFDECPKCEAWDSSSAQKEEKANRALRLSDYEAADDERITTGRADWDAALAGGMTKNMVLLVPGKPGFGKTSELLRIAHHIGTKRSPVAFGSSERPIQAISLRAKQLDVDRDRIVPARVHTSEEFLEHVEATGAKHAMLDSWGGLGRARDVEHVKQLREIIGEGSLWIVCHVTKSGELAGESVLEHEVDAVVWVRRKSLRTSKNWHGPAPLSTRRQLPTQETAQAKSEAADPAPRSRSSAAARLRVVR